MEIRVQILTDAEVRRWGYRERSSGLTHVDLPWQTGIVVGGLSRERTSELGLDSHELPILLVYTSCRPRVILTPKFLY